VFDDGKVVALLEDSEKNIYTCLITRMQKIIIQDEYMECIQIHCTIAHELKGIGIKTNIYE
jgi:hypothetical protein